MEKTWIITTLTKQGKEVEVEVVAPSKLQAKADWLAVAPNSVIFHVIEKVTPE